MSGRSDVGLRKRAQRKQRERGCSVYIPAELLQASGFPLTGPAPWYRVWGGRRGRFVVTLYSTGP